MEKVKTMVKALVLTALTVSVTGGAFAQTQPDGLTLAGSLQTGFEVHSGETDVTVFDLNDPIFLMHDADAKSAFRLRFGAEYKKELFGTKLRFDVEVPHYPVDISAEHIGEKIGESAQDSYAAKSLDKNLNLEDAAPKLGLGYAWANFGSFLTVSGGKIVDNAWETEGDFEDGYDGAGYLRFEIKPVKGLNFGVSLGDHTRIFNAIPIQSLFKNLILGAKYENEDAGFSAILAAKLDYGEKYEEVYVDAATAGTSDPAGSVLGTQQRIEPSKSTDLIFGVKYVGLEEKLSLALDGQITQIGAEKEKVTVKEKEEELNPGYADIRLSAGYQISDPLSASLLVKALFADAVNDDGEKILAVPLYIAPGITYKVAPFLYVGFEGRFYLDKVENLDAVRANDGISLDHQIGYKDEDFSFALLPNAVLALNEHAYFVLYDEIAFEDGDARNIFGINFRWSF
ncbi:MAG: hypothetical protein LBS97_01725 [Treponema sp.]|jgi:hypothetical protein|nr:hypothetical protein [Treponema sp.]